MKPKMRSALRFGGSLVVGVSILVALFLYVDIDKLSLTLQGASLPIIAFSMMLGFLALVIKGWRWRLLLSPLKNSIPIRSTFWITAIGGFVNDLLPIHVAGDLVKSMLLDKKEGVSMIAALSSLIVERVLDFIAILSLTLISLYLLPDVFTALAPILNTIGFLAASSLILLVIVLISTKKKEAGLLYVRRLLEGVPLFRSEKRRKMVGEMISFLILGAQGLFSKPRTSIKIFIATWAIWLLQFLGVYATFLALNYYAPPMPVLLGTMLLNLAFILPSVPGYVGVLEAFWMAIYTMVGLTADPSLLLALAVVNHILTILSITVLGVIGILWMGLSIRDIMSLRQIQQGREGDREIPPI